MTAPVLHIVFSDTVAGSLTEALRQVGRNDCVISLPDDLSFGPINPPDPATRRKWVRQHLSPDLRESEWPVKQTNKFWKAALAASARRIVWVSKRAAHEYAGYLEFVWRLGDAPCEVFEFAGDQVTYCRPDGGTTGWRTICLGELPPQHFVEKRYWESARPIDGARRARDRANWARLRQEDAPLRILSESGMISAPITYFDDRLLSCTIGQWRKVARVIGEALVGDLDAPFHQVGDFVLHARLCALARSGRLESRGDMGKPRYSEVRRLPEEANKGSEAPFA